VLEQGTFEVPRGEEQKLTIADLLQRAFARRSERYIHDPNHLPMASAK